MAKGVKKNGSGKKHQKSKLHLKNSTTKELEMHLSLWYSKDVEQWRWTLSSATDAMDMESGNATELEVALKDVKNTIEWMVNPSIA